MGAFLLFFLHSAISVAAAQQNHLNITLGSSLTASSNSSWLSPSALYAFGFFPQANNASAIGVFILGHPTKTVVWTANPSNPAVPNDAVLQLTQEGILVLQQTKTDVIILSQPIHYASMFDTGNFVLYNSDSRIIWQSFDHPTDTLLTGQRLLPNGMLVSSASETDCSRGIFMLAMQSDGNLVQYPLNAPYTPPYAYYASGTFGVGSNVSLNLADDGRLYLLNGSSFLRNLSMGGLPARGMVHLMRIDVDGIFRTYSQSLSGNDTWAVIWSSTDNRCAPIGRCGFNAFCVQMDQDVNCLCLPGFDYVLRGNWTASCRRNFTGDVCGDTDGRVRYEMRAAENTVWEDNSYATTNAATIEDCQRACLDDCNCEAAFYKNGQCSKQRLPLSYGRRQLSDSNVALIRVSTPREAETSAVQPMKQIKKEVRIDILIISISVAVMGFLGMLLSVIYVGRNYRAYKRITGSSSSGEVKLIEDVAQRAFTYSEIAKATNNFEEEIGKGASGTVYKGIPHDSQKMVAVKRLEKDLAQGGEEFQMEIKTIGKTYHRNLVRILGYSLDGPEKLLVLEYMSNGSLADMLFKSKILPSWEERTRLARDIARGITYLHEECETQIIHCDIKPQNILMDEHGCAKISDFGLAKLLKQDQTNTYTRIRGTRGYAAPEWHQQQRVTVKVDVYSFGIVLLEIICCRRSVDSSLPEEEVILKEWIYDCYEQGEVGKILVGKEEQVDQRKVERMVKIGIWCIQEDPSLRPSMKKVLLMLEGIMDIPVPPSHTSFFSTAV